MLPDVGRAVAAEWRQEGANVQRPGISEFGLKRKWVGCLSQLADEGEATAVERDRRALSPDAARRALPCREAADLVRDGRAVADRLRRRPRRLRRAAAPPRPPPSASLTRNPSRLNLEHEEVVFGDYNRCKIRRVRGTRFEVKLRIGAGCEKTDDLPLKQVILKQREQVRLHK